MLILGIDPGTTRAGYGLIERAGGAFRYVSSGLFSTSSGSAGDRLSYIEKELTAILLRFRPDTAGVERLYFSRNKKTALRVAEARGVILGVLARQSVPCVELSPNTVKQSITGSGRASKQAVARMVGSFLHIRVVGCVDDVTDALAVAIAAADTVARDNY